MEPCKRCSRPEIGKTVIHAGKCPKKKGEEYTILNIIDELKVHFPYSPTYSLANIMTYASNIYIPVSRCEWYAEGTMSIGHHIIHGIAE